MFYVPAWTWDAFEWGQADKQLLKQASCAAAFSLRFHTSRIYGIVAVFNYSPPRIIICPVFVLFCYAISDLELI